MFRLEIDGTNHCTIPPSTVSDVFLLLLYLWVVTNSQMCMFEFAWWEKKENKGELSLAKNSHWEWCKARLFNSGGQFDPDRWCNSSTSTMLAHSRAIIAYDNGRSKIRGVRGGGGGGGLPRDWLSYRVGYILVHYSTTYSTHPGQWL